MDIWGSEHETSSWDLTGCGMELMILHLESLSEDETDVAKIRGNEISSRDKKRMKNTEDRFKNGRREWVSGHETSSWNITGCRIELDIVNLQTSSEDEADVERQPVTDACGAMRKIWRGLETDLGRMDQVRSKKWFGYNGLLVWWMLR